MPEAAQPTQEEAQGALLDLLKTHYAKGGMSEEGLQSLAAELEEAKQSGAGAEEIAKLLGQPTDQDGAAPAKARRIKPEGVMCIKTWNVDEKKVFFNLCTSTSIDPPELVMRDGQEQTRLPMSLGAPCEDVDHKGDACTVYDIIFNPEALEQNDATFTQFIVELCMMRVEEKYPDRPKLNAKRNWKKLRQKEWKGRELQEQSIRDEPNVRMVDGGSGLRDFSRPEAAEPTWEAKFATRKRDRCRVLRLRIELPGLRPEEITVEASKEFIRVFAVQLGELRYKLECPCQRPEGYIHLTTRFHSANHTLTMVWGPPEAKAFDDDALKKAQADAKAAEESRRIQLSNETMFDIDCSDDD